MIRRNWLIIPMVLAIAGLALGCGTTEKAEETADHSSPADKDAHAHDTPAATEMAEATTLEGKLGCGHCNYKVGNECSLAMQTASGEVFLIEATQNQEELMAQRYDQPAVKVEGKVSEVDGLKVIYTDSVLLQ